LLFPVAKDFRKRKRTYVSPRLTSASPTTIQKNPISVTAALLGDDDTVRGR
jgi:hypothetical protein